jgi:hypothetical protein
MAADAFDPFERWVSKRAELWSHLHFAAVAVRVGEDWFAIAGALHLAPTADPPRRVGCPIFATDEICALCFVTSASALPDLIAHLRRGAIPEGSLPGLDRTIRVECPAGTPLLEDGGSEYTRPGTVGFGRSEPLRFEARLRGEAIGKLFPDALAAQELLRRLDRECEGAGQGSISELCDDLRLRDMPGGDINLGTWAAFRLEAALPFWIANTGQDADRSCVEVTLAIPERVPRVNLQLVYRAKPGGRVFDPVGVPEGGPNVTFVVAREPPLGDAEVILSYAKQKVDSQHVRVRPPLRIWPALVAMGVLDSDLTLLKEGLTGEDAVRHERSVAHLLGLLGFSSFWWGPNVKQKKLPLPQDAPDVVLCSDDQQVVIVIECTTEQLGDKKLRYLVDRTKGVRDRLREVLAEDAPLVRPLLALARPRGRVPESLLNLIRADGAGILTMDDATDLLDMVSGGVPRSEQLARFDQLFLHPQLPLPDYWPSR